MRKRRRTKTDILIDLTSLLDVIFIILMVVICNQQNLTMKLQASKEQAQQVEEKAEAAYQLYTDQVDTAKYSLVISVTATYQKDAVTERKISVLIPGEEIKDFKLSGNNTREALENFKKELIHGMEIAAGKPVVLSLNEEDDNILYRDEKAIKKIFEELVEEYANAFIR